MLRIIDYIEVDSIEDKQIKRFWNFVHKTVKHRKAVEAKLKKIHGSNYTHWRRKDTSVQVEVKKVA